MDEVLLARTTLALCHHKILHSIAYYEQWSLDLQRKIICRPHEIYNVAEHITAGKQTCLLWRTLIRSNAFTDSAFISHVQVDSASQVQDLTSAALV